MNLLTLKIFESVLRNGNFLAAAKENNCSQSSVSFHIKNLEEFLGVQLFEKTGRYLRPTPVVQEIIPDIKVILDAYSSLEKFKFKEKELVGTLKVGFNDALVNDKLAAVFQKFKKIAPNVTLLAESASTAYELKEKVLKNELDLAISFNCGDYPHPLSTYPLDSEPLVLAVGGSVKIEENAFKLVNNKINLPFISADLSGGPSKFFLRYLSQLGITFENQMQVGSLEAVLSLLKNNFGFAYVFESRCAEEIRSGQVKILPTLLGDVDLGILLLKNKTHTETPAISLMSKLIISTLQNRRLERNHFIERTCLMKRKKF